jgi:SAM-dependent methyltransferase
MEFHPIMSMKKVKIDKQFYENAWGQWDDMKSFGPSSRHVRRLIFKMLKGLEFKTYLDAGCGVGTLLQDFHDHYPDVELNGAEYASSGVTIARQKNPNSSIYQLNLAKQGLPQKFDLITCVDVLEHINEDQIAMNHLHEMTSHYLLVVVPTGPLFEQERLGVGHVHGYSQAEVKAKLEKAGFKILKEMAWGFPLYNLYRRLVMNMPEESVSGNFDWKKRTISEILYLLLFFNLPYGGERYYVLCSA